MFLLKKISSKISHKFAIIDYKNQLRAIDNAVTTCTIPGTTKDLYAGKEIIVSLTSYGIRLRQVYRTIETLMQQSCKPNRIILWLEEKEYKMSRYSYLPELKKRGLEILPCKNGLRSYKKLIPCLQAFPEDIIITVDDDVFYHPNTLENLILSYLSAPNEIHFNRGHEIKIEKQKIQPYVKWRQCVTTPTSSFLNFPTGVGGVLYPPHSLNKEVLNEDCFMSLCPTGDDIWFKAMSLLQNVKCKKTVTFDLQGNDFDNNMAPEILKTALSLTNTGKEALNDIQIEKVFKKYNLLDMLY